jgi:hypothetical protein
MGTKNSFQTLVDPVQGFSLPFSLQIHGLMVRTGKFAANRQ